MLKERYILASERIREIPEEKGMVEASFEGFFQTLARLILNILALTEAGCEERKAAPAGDLLKEIRPGSYEKSFACPSFACSKLGEDLGRPLSVLYYEIYGMILPAFLGKEEEMLIRMELFLEIYQAFVIEFRETGGVPEGKYITGKIGQYLADYFREETLRRLQDLSCEADPGEEESSAFYSLSSVLSETQPSALLSGEEDIERAAAVLSGKLAGSAASPFTCGLGISLGPGRMKTLAAALERRGIKAIPYVGRRSLFDLREDLSAPFFPQADPRFYIDHREDLGLFLDESLRTRILQALESALSEEGDVLSSFGGWILSGVREEKGLRPDPMAVRYGRHQRKLLSGLLESCEERIREAGLCLGEEDALRLP